MTADEGLLGPVFTSCAKTTHDLTNCKAYVALRLSVRLSLLRDGQPSQARAALLCSPLSLLDVGTLRPLLQGCGEF